MKIKVIETNNGEDLEKLTNEFDDTHYVQFSQSHVTYNMIKQSMVYSIVLFWSKEK